MIRVAIFNDSATMRARLRVCLEQSNAFQVVLEAEDGRAARQRVVSSGAELVLMDVIMPHVDGYAATRDIIEGRPVPIVIVTAALNARDSAVIFSALAAGALYVTAPPPPDNPQQTASFLQLLRAMAGATPKLPSALKEARKPTLPPPKASASPIKVIAFAASAGGPQGLMEVLQALPPGLPPILIVQHLAANFERSFAAWLGSNTKHRVVVAEHGMRAEFGTVYLAGDDSHTLWQSGTLVLSDEPPVDHFRPSATALLRSIASEKDRALAVVFSGMGTDGADGAVAVHRAGGHVVVQNKASAAVWGMPGEVVRRGAADAQLPVSEIADHLLLRCALRADKP